MAVGWVKLVILIDPLLLGAGLMVVFLGLRQICFINFDQV